MTSFSKVYFIKNTGRGHTTINYNGVINSDKKGHIKNFLLSI